ncbi:hypothetical protein LMG1864_05146 [Achromobacter ruhlandii]|nr:hypothetical protein LMG1864_05146 [Achromobacter ruhlandii]
MRAAFQRQGTAGELAVTCQRRLIGKHADGAVAGVDGAGEQFADFQRGTVLQGDLSVVAALVGIRGGDGGAPFRFLRQWAAVVLVDIQRRAAQDDPRAARIDVALQRSVARQAESAVRQRQLAEGEMARFPIRLVERYGLSQDRVIAEIPQHLGDIRRIDGMDDGMPLENHFALARADGVVANGNVAVGDEGRVRLVDDVDVEIVCQASRENELGAGGKILPLARVGQFQREILALSSVFPVVVAGLGGRRRNGREAVLLQDEIVYAAPVQVAAYPGTGARRHDDVVGDRGGADRAQVDRHAGLSRGAVGDRGAMVQGVVGELIERDVVAVDVQHAAARAPLDAVGIDLPGVAQHDFGAAAGNGDAGECLNLVVSAWLLREDDLALTHAQAARVDAGAADGQGAGADLVEVVAGHAIDVPRDRDVLLHVDARAHPGLVRVGGNGVVVVESQCAGALVDRVFQADLAGARAARGAKGEVLSRIQAREVERAVGQRKRRRLLVAVHGVGGAGGLLQGARALRTVEGPGQRPVAGRVDDVRVVVLLENAVDEVVGQVRPIDVAALFGHFQVRRRAGDHPLCLRGVPRKQGGAAIALLHV